MSTPTQNMLIITSVWGDKKTFRLIPIANECPYSEGIYDPESKVLVMMSTTKKETYQMLPKLDDNGDPMPAESKRLSGKNYREERKSFETFNEYYITEKEEIINIVDMFACNKDTFDYKKYLNTSGIITGPEKKIELIS